MVPGKCGSAAIRWWTSVESSSLGSWSTGVQPVADLWCRVVVDDLVGVPFWMVLHGLDGFVDLLWQLGHGGIVVGHGLTGAHGSGGLASTLRNELGQLQWLRVRTRFVLATNCKIQGSRLRI